MTEDLGELRAKAEQGDAASQYQLGIRCFLGDGTDQNLEEAYRWISESARQDHSDGERTRLTIGNMTIDIKEYSLYMDDVQVSMTKKELETVWTLANNPEKLFTRDNLLNSIWGYDYYGETRTVDTHIKRIRGKLDAYPHPDWSITTVWGAGYKFVINKDSKN